MATKTWICGCHAYRRAVFMGTNLSAITTYCGSAALLARNASIFSKSISSAIGSSNTRVFSSFPKGKISSRANKMLYRCEPFRSVSSNSVPMKNNRGWTTYSLGKKLLVLWGGAFAAIGLVIVANYYLYGKETGTIFNYSARH